MREEPVQIELLGKQYVAVRCTDADLITSYIEVSEPSTGRCVARVEYNSTEGVMTLDAYGNVLLRRFIEELFNRADLALC